MTIYYPEGLPRGLHSGRKYQLVSPLQRSELDSGRARQRRRFTSVPEGVSVSWLFNDSQGQAFEAWWRDQLIDGSVWFECPLGHPLGYDLYTCRFTGVYQGPTRVGPNLWSYSGELELRERAALETGWGEFPEFILESSILDYAINRELPLNEWQIYIEAADTAINQDWPKP
jgi:hypothetical protein